MANGNGGAGIDFNVFTQSDIIVTNDFRVTCHLANIVITSNVAVTRNTKHVVLARHDYRVTKNRVVVSTYRDVISHHCIM